MQQVCFTVDVEPDCPPYLTGWRGVETGLPLLLDLLRREGVPATFFTTGESALAHPWAARAVLADGHELACHGHTHRAFPTLTAAEAHDEIARSTEVLRDFGPIRSFRAPYLRLPFEHLPILEAEGFGLDSSVARYKVDHFRRAPATSLLRIPASVTSSVLRLPPALRDPYMLLQRPPLVLFCHPWEFVDMTAEAIPWDCRAGTGEPALEGVASTLRMLKARGARFCRMDAFLDDRPRPAQA